MRHVILTGRVTNPIGDRHGIFVCPSVSCRLNHARNSAYKSPRVTSRKPLPSLARFLIPSLNSLFEKIT